MRNILMAVVLLAAFAGVGNAQSLADVAKAEEARRAALAAPVKVIKQEDLKKDETAPTGVTPSTPAPSTAATTTTETTTEKDKTVKDEAYWRGRMRELTTKFQADFAAAEAAHLRERAGCA